MKKIIYILSLIAIGSIYSCSEKKQKYNNEPSNFFFKVPGTDIGITTSKVPGAQFYVVFAKDSVLPSDTVDYIKFVGIFHFLYMKKRFHQGGNFPRRGKAE